MSVKFVIDAQSGDIDALAKLYSRTLKSSYFLALKLTADDKRAIELTKNAYAKIFCTIGNLAKPEAYEIWIKQTVANTYKENQTFVFGDADATVTSQAVEFLPEYVFGDEVLSRRLEQAVAMLPDVQRAAVVLFYNNGMPIAALSRYLGVSESTAGALLLKAKRAITEALGSPHGDFSAEAQPVLTRTFQRSASQVNIEASTVRDIFIYASGEFNKKAEAAKNAEPELPPIPQQSEKSEPLPEKKPEAAPAAEQPAAEEKPAPEPAPAPEKEPEKPKDDLSYFNREPATVANEIIGTMASDSEGEGKDALEMIKNSLSIETEEKEEKGISFEGYQGISSLTKPVEDAAAPKQSKAKIIIIAAAAVLIVAVVIALALFMGNKNKDDTTTAPGETTVALESASSEYKWTPGGLEAYSEISYFNEFSCKIRSAQTGLYGLMDYQGNVLLEPTFADFTRCSNGKDYTNRSSYHYLVQIEAAQGSPKYELTFSDTDVIISTTPHTQHSSDTDIIDSNKYDERDRFFEGYAAARKDGKWGYVSEDKDKEIIPFDYEAVNNLSTAEAACADYCRAVNGGLVAVKKNGIMGIVDLKNNIVVPFEYSNILQGDNGVFIACKAGTWGVITVGAAITSFEGFGSEATTLSGEDLEGAEIFVDTFVVTSDVNVRSNAGADYEKLGEIAEGTIVVTSIKKTADNGKDWVCVDFQGGSGWISMSLLDEAPEGATATPETTTAAQTTSANTIA